MRLRERFRPVVAPAGVPAVPGASLGVLGGATSGHGDVLTDHRATVTARFKAFELAIKGKAVRALIDGGADPHPTNGNSSTPKHPGWTLIWRTLI